MVLPVKGSSTSEGQFWFLKALIPHNPSVLTINTAILLAMIDVHILTGRENKSGGLYKIEHSIFTIIFHIHYSQSKCSLYLHRSLETLKNLKNP